MKKFFLCLLAVVLCIPALAFVGCDADDHRLNMERYFEKTVSYQTYPSYAYNDGLSIKTFLDNKHDSMAQYSQFEFTGVSDWVYRLHLEKLTFQIYSNIDLEVQFQMTITNLVNGNIEGSKGTMKKQVPVKLKRNKAVTVTVAIDDVVDSLTSPLLRIRFEFTDGSAFKQNDVETGLKYDIMNFQVYGYHESK